MALSGANVTVIDADPNRPVARWGRLPGRPENLTVIEDVTERSIIATIDREAALVSFVVVDLEGTASRMIPYAMSRADLVIIPSRGSTLDAVEAVAAIREVREQEAAFRVKIPAAILLTNTSPAIKPRTLSSIMAEFRTNGVPVFSTQLHDREAFRAVFSFGGTVSGLDESSVRNIPAAIKNAREFAAEVVTMLRANRVGEQAA